MTKNILLIDHDVMFLGVIKYMLEQQSFCVQIADSGIEGISLLPKFQPDLILLDVSMPGMNGFETCNRIKKITQIPVVFLTSESSEKEEIVALESGGVGYIAKTVTPTLFLSRLNAILRQLDYLSIEEKRYHSYQDEYLSVDLDRMQIFVQSAAVELTKTEFRLFSYLFQNTNRACSYAQILENVWGWKRGDSSIIHVYVSRLRQKIEKDPRNPQYLLTSYQYGYRLDLA